MKRLPGLRSLPLELYISVQCSEGLRDADQGGPEEPEYTCRYQAEPKVRESRKVWGQAGVQQPLPALFLGV